MICPPSPPILGGTGKSHSPPELGDLGGNAESAVFTDSFPDSATPQLKLGALSKIATTYAELNDWSRAAELFSRMLQITQTVSNDRVKTEALKEIAYAVVKLNN